MRAGFLEVRTVDEGNELRNILGTSRVGLRCRSEEPTFCDLVNNGWQTGMGVPLCAHAPASACAGLSCCTDKAALVIQKALSVPDTPKCMDHVAEEDDSVQDDQGGKPPPHRFPIEDANPWTLEDGGDSTPWISEDCTWGGHATSKDSAPCGASHSEYGTTCGPSEGNINSVHWISEVTPTEFLPKRRGTVGGTSDKSQRARKSLRLCKVKRERLHKLAESLVEKEGVNVEEILSREVPKIYQGNKFVMGKLQGQIERMLVEKTNASAIASVAGLVESAEANVSSEPQQAQNQQQQPQQQQQVAWKRQPGPNIVANMAMATHRGPVQRCAPRWRLNGRGGTNTSNILTPSFVWAPTPKVGMPMLCPAERSCMSSPWQE